MSFAKGEDATILRAKQGQEFKVKLVNLIDEEIWLHWFGVRGPAEMMTLNIQPGETEAIECVFTPPDAGTFWFGPMIGSSKQREMGLYGVLIVEEAEPVSGLEDVPVVLDDWLLEGDGLAGGFGSLEAAIAEGRPGNWFTVNGRFRNRLVLPAGAAARLRVLNAANSRTMGLLFKGADPLIAALDGQPVPPRNLGQGALKLAPGQRADLIVTETPDLIVLALDLFEDVVEIGYLEPAKQSASLPENFALPQNPLPQPGDLAMAAILNLRIEGGEKGGLKQAKVAGEMLELRALLERGIAWAVNGEAGPGAAPTATFKPGETVIAVIENATAFEQPLHIHGHVWREVDGNGNAPEGAHWSDTAIVARGETRNFVLVASEGVWVIQSLVAERVDAGLMTAFAAASPL
ncbi:MAG: multicopper oxidase family protein [Rhizobiales bacterium]|nr:multicopper oxidase family protein [Hyphomicrobiales bacterium]